MKSFDLNFDKKWKVLGGTKKSQAAIMVLEKGSVTGGPDNKHEESDQWMLVMGGKGEAIVNKKKIALKRNLLLLIEAGEPHEIRNIGTGPLKTLNFYAPKEY